MAFTTESVLHINTGHIYWSEHHQQHAEEIFVNTSSISPNDTKPIIYIGKIWDGDDSNNHQGLINMIIVGFTLQVWDTPKNRDIQQTRSTLLNSK